MQPPRYVKLPIISNLSSVTVDIEIGPIRSIGIIFHFHGVNAELLFFRQTANYLRMIMPFRIILTEREYFLHILNLWRFYILSYEEDNYPVNNSYRTLFITKLLGNDDIRQLSGLRLSS